MMMKMKKNQWYVFLIDDKIVLNVKGLKLKLMLCRILFRFLLHTLMLQKFPFNILAEQNKVLNLLHLGLDNIFSNTRKTEIGNY